MLVTLNRTIMKCRYCEIIHTHDPHYRIRRATRDLESTFPRCSWHWQYICDRCESSMSFHGVAWCEEHHEFVCLTCASRHKKVKRSFWAWEYYYSIWCDKCKRFHPALDWLEHKGEHPWQVHTTARRTLKGLSKTRKTERWYFLRWAPDTLQRPSLEVVQKRWNKSAELWDAGYTKQGDSYRRHIFNPPLFKLIGSAKGKRVLDAGCGAGYMSRLLAEKGAKVTGIDLSAKFIELANRYEREKPLGIRYLRGDLARMPQLRDAYFDLVVSVYVLCDVRDYGKAVKEIARVLKPKGRFVFLIEHPCFNWSAGGWERIPLDSQRTEDWLYLKVDNYFRRGTEECQWGKLPRLLCFRRPLSDYFTSLKKNGFFVKDLIEPRPSRKASLARPRHWDKENRVPPVLIIEAVKRDM
jgi:ubiquinone/menaquinone biosynthesis C-methylase UbiE